MRSSKHSLLAIWTFLIVGGVGSALGYFATATALAAEPPAKAYDGWIAVLQPAGNVDQDVQVRVHAVALPDVAETRMAYGIAVCGSDPFDGFFLIGRDARLHDMAIDAGPDTVQQLPEGDLTVYDEGDGTTTTYRDVQVLRVSIEKLNPCMGAIDDESYAGTGFRIEGNALSPVASTSAVLLDGAVERWSMPYVGGLPGKGQRVGVFRIEGAVAGEFVRPLAFAADIDAGPVPLDLELSDARPPTESVDRAAWYQPGDIQATAKVRDSDYETTLQRWSVGFAIALGVFGSVMASMLFEWIRPRRGLNLAVATTEPVPEPRRSVVAVDPKPRTAITWLLVAGVGYVLGRVVKRRRR